MGPFYHGGLEKYNLTLGKKVTVKTALESFPGTV